MFDEFKFKIHEYNYLFVFNSTTLFQFDKTDIIFLLDKSYLKTDIIFCKFLVELLHALEESEIG